MTALARLVFFSTGHALDFASLHLEAGFVGKSTFQFHYAGGMLIVNTFGHLFLFVGVLRALFPTTTTTTTSSDEGKGKITKVDETAARISTDTVILHAHFTVLVSCVTAFVLRRHLMIWAVFAPKLAFETSMWLAQMVLLLYT